jgi:hypothetical protein
MASGWADSNVSRHPLPWRIAALAMITMRLTGCFPPPKNTYEKYDIKVWGWALFWMPQVTCLEPTGLPWSYGQPLASCGPSPAWQLPADPARTLGPYGATVAVRIGDAERDDSSGLPGYGVQPNWHPTIRCAGLALTPCLLTYFESGKDLGPQQLTHGDNSSSQTLYLMMSFGCALSTSTDDPASALLFAVPGSSNVASTNKRQRAHGADGDPDVKVQGLLPGTDALPNEQRRERQGAGGAKDDMEPDEAGKGRGKGGRAKKGGGKKDTKDMEKLLEAVAKHVPIQALHHRELQSIILIMIIMDLMAKPDLAMKEAGKTYHDKAAGKSPEKYSEERDAAIPDQPQAMKATKLCKLGKCWPKDRVKAPLHTAPCLATCRGQQRYQEVRTLASNNGPLHGEDYKKRKKLHRHLGPCLSNNLTLAAARENRNTAAKKAFNTLGNQRKKGSTRQKPPFEAVAIASAGETMMWDLA